MEDPREDHMEALKHLLRYVAATTDFGLQYDRGNGELRLLGYSDSDLAADIDGRRSTTGVLFRDGNGSGSGRVEQLPAREQRRCG
jgi:hypothetical protein